MKKEKTKRGKGTWGEVSSYLMLGVASGLLLFIIVLIISRVVSDPGKSYEEVLVERSEWVTFEDPDSDLVMRCVQASGGRLGHMGCVEIDS